VAFEHMILSEAGGFFLLALLVALCAWAPATSRGLWMRSGTLGVALAAA
jgi:hypothetical protein